MAASAPKNNQFLEGSQQFYQCKTLDLDNVLSWGNPNIGVKIGTRSEHLFGIYYAQKYRFIRTQVMEIITLFLIRYIIRF